MRDLINKDLSTVLRTERCIINCMNFELLLYCTELKHMNYRKYVSGSCGSCSNASLSC